MLVTDLKQSFTIYSKQLTAAFLLFLVNFIKFIVIISTKSTRFLMDLLVYMDDFIKKTK